jgi:hypothetical protein
MEKLSPEVIKIGALVLSLLLAGNIFFIKRLVDQLDKVGETMRRIEIEVAVLKSKFAEA